MLKLLAQCDIKVELLICHPAKLCQALFGTQLRRWGGWRGGAMAATSRPGQSTCTAKCQEMSREPLQFGGLDPSKAIDYEATLSSVWRGARSFCRILFVPI